LKKNCQMVFYTPIVPVSPMRAEASHRSEMVSQLLFGELAELLDTSKDFIQVRTLYDNYIGWIQCNQLVEVSESAAMNGGLMLSGDIVRAISCNGEPMQISFGCPLYFFNHGHAKIGKFEFEYEGKFWIPDEAHFNEATLKWVANQFLNTAYLWGGRTVSGIDCSGFTQQVFRFVGVKLPRDASQQVNIGEVVGFLQEAKCGDLAFFDNAERKITHVGMMLDQSTIIHASGKVRVDPIDNMGIINADTGERTHQLRIIKRYHTF
jgi:gamma-D-glutamyl-L-lysine dipeptidyl-peptidase